MPSGACRRSWMRTASKREQAGALPLLPASTSSSCGRCPIDAWLHYRCIRHCAVIKLCGFAVFCQMSSTTGGTTMSGREVLNMTMSDTQRTSVAELREEAGRSMEISPSQVRVVLDSR